MRFVCLWSPRWQAGGAPLAELATALLDEVPRVAVEARGVLWADVRGLAGARLAHALLKRLPGETRAGLSDVPIAAEIAARTGPDPLTIVEPGGERAFLAGHPLMLLDPPRRLRPLLAGVGLATCGQLAALGAEALEVRFGPEALALWKLCRADDPRLLFGPIPLGRAHASFDFVDYQVSDAARLIFTVNGLLSSVLSELKRRGERSRRLVLTLSLGSGGTLRRELRASRPTSERAAWIDRIREELSDLKLLDTVGSVALESADDEAASATQGDFFDRGFATRGAVEEAVGRLVDEMGPVFVAPRRARHPLADRGVRWEARTPGQVAERSAGERSSAPPPAAPALALQLLPAPRPVAVRVRARRDHALPTAVREGREWEAVVEAAGPDRVSGGLDSAGFAREYFRCVTEAGRLLWVYRDAVSSQWYLHGWWD